MRKNAFKKRSQEARTGGTPSGIVLTEEDDKVLRIIGNDKVFGISGATETGLVDFEFDTSGGRNDDGNVDLRLSPYFTC